MKRKNYKDIFRAYENPAFEYLNIKNQDVKVKIYWNNGFAFKIEFIFENKSYKKEFAPIKSKEYIFGGDEINFDEIELSEIDKNRLADRLTDILNYHFD